MKTATSTLRTEHEAILSMLEATEEAARRAELGEPVSAGTLAGLLEFFKVFADRCHHGKEEELLFPLLERKGMPRNGGPVGVMLVEHEQGRALMRRMTAALEELTAGNAGACRIWAEAARAYSALLRAHINKENNILFMMAERLLSEAEQAELAEAFEKLEAEKIGAGTHERLHGSMKELRAEIFAPVHAAR
ncbi:MAG: hemerythrin domain-containing protein [Acidobacteriia bacterium]|nr:hemerythrin domain-containing protein [Terriglobia bacterium]